MQLFYRGSKYESAPSQPIVDATEQRLGIYRGCAIAFSASASRSVTTTQRGLTYRGATY